MDAQVQQKPLQKRKLDIKNILILIGANIITLVTVLASGGGALELIWIYWVQSVIIGILNIHRLFTAPVRRGKLTEEEYNQATEAMGKAAIPEVVMEKGLGYYQKFLAGFFAFHYGMFHLVYAYFLTVFTFTPKDAHKHDPLAGTFTISAQNFSFEETGISFVAIFISVSMFAVHHILSYVAEKKAMHSKLVEPSDLTLMMISPYKRILPMHLIIILGGFLLTSDFGQGMINGETILIIIFVALKTLADVSLSAFGVSHPRLTDVRPLAHDSPTHLPNHSPHPPHGRAPNEDRLQNQ